MFTLNARQDLFRLTLPDDFIAKEINEKYSKIINDNKSFIRRPIDFLNETIQSVQVLGFVDGTVQQQQSAKGSPIINQNRKLENQFMHTATDYNYRSEKNPLALIDKTLNIFFRHTLGFLNYFLIFENFFYLYSRDRKYQEMPDQIPIDIMNNRGEVYSRIIVIDPVINGIDMLDLNYNAPNETMSTFKVEFKYSNIDYVFINTSDEEEEFDFNRDKTIG